MSDLETSQQDNQILVIFRKAPAGSAWAREALDLALVGAAFGQKVSLLFMGDGVFQLLEQQNPKLIGQKGTQAMMQALPMYEIDNLYVEGHSLAERGLDLEQLAVNCQVLNADEMPKLLQQHQQVFNF